jgi:hypothetical protein
VVGAGPRRVVSPRSCTSCIPLRRERCVRQEQNSVGGECLLIYAPAEPLRELAAIDRALPLRERLLAAVLVLQRRLSEVFGVVAAVGCGGPRQPRGRRPPRDADDAFRDMVVDLIGPDAAALRVPAVGPVRVLRTFAGTHPIAGVHTLDGLLARPTTTEDP